MLYLTVLAFLCALMLAIAAVSAAPLIGKQLFGKQIFFDTALSSPDGRSCGSCHVPEVGFSDPDKILPVSEGITPLRVGPRNAPTVTYLATAPDFQLVAGAFVGGQFWDSRALNLVEQAKLPFLNTLEMHNPKKYLVVHDLVAQTPLTTP